MKQDRMQNSIASRSISGWIGTGLMASTLLVVCPAAAATLSAWQFDPATQQLTVTLPQGVVPQVQVAPEPTRIILVIPQTALGQVETEQTYDGPVTSVRLSEGDAGSLQIVLELAPGTVLEPDSTQLTSMTAGDQTRWMLTALIAEAGTVALGSPAGDDPVGVNPSPSSSADVIEVPALPLSEGEVNPPLNPPPGSAAPPPATESTSPPSSAATGMIVELPVIPAADPGLGFPGPGQGRLSTTAANLMLPDDVNSLENLPETLPIDPFSIGLAETEQVTVPGLDELDAEVAPLATVPQEAVPTSESLASSPADGASPGGSDAAAFTTAGPTDAGADPQGMITVVPPSSATTGNAPVPGAESPSVAVVEPANSPGANLEDAADSVDTPGPGEEDLSTENQPITDAPPAVTAEAETIDTAPDIDGASGEEPLAAPATVAADAAGEEATSPAEPEAVELSVVPAPPSAEVSSPAVSSGSPGDGESPAIATEPLPPPQTDSPGGNVTPINEVPPETSVVAEPSPSEDILLVPTIPTSNSTAAVVPPRDPAPGEFVVAAAEPINFGQPLPGTVSRATYDDLNEETVAPQNEQIPPDILIAAGTVLQLRYPGTEPLVLEPGANLNEVLVLESEIRDPITQGVLAPRGSQLIGQFQPNGTNQNWISEMLIVPAGQRVPLASTSEYLIGTPQVNGGRVAAGMGAGALALAILTSFSGIGLLGGAIVGATTMVGTSPQQVVIEPNQIIAVQVTENVPRAMPIATGPDFSREWGR